MKSDKKTRVAINGFGRIGRNLCRILLQQKNIELVAINDIAPIETMAHLLKYDSIHGIFSDKIKIENQHLVCKGKKIVYVSEKEIDKLPWKSLDIDIVVEATGKFKTKLQLEKHLQAGAKKVLLSAPPEDDSIKTIVLGVNEHIIEPIDVILSNASCTTNNAAPMITVIDQLCGVQNAYITTVHSYTTDQSLHDQPHKDLRRARAAAQSIVPTTTGAAKALTKVFPHLDGKMGGCGIRVPVPNGSLTDITFQVKNTKSIAQINAAFKKASKSTFKNIIEYTEDPIVSKDIVGNKNSCVFDAQLTSVLDNMIKIVGWYDNEIGYSNRLLDLIILLSKK